MGEARRRQLAGNYPKQAKPKPAVKKGGSARLGTRNAMPLVMSLLAGLGVGRRAGK